MTNPCHGCPDRKENCHAGCEDYKAWTASRAQERRNRDLEYQGEPEHKMRNDFVKMSTKKFKRRGRF